MRITVLWDVAPCSLVEIHRHFFIYSSCLFLRYVSPMEFTLKPLVVVRFEVVTAVTNKIVALLHVRTHHLVNT